MNSKKMRDFMQLEIFGGGGRGLTGCFTLFHF